MLGINRKKQLLSQMILFQLKAVILDSNLQVLVQAEVKFDTDLPEFRTIGGVNSGLNKNE